MGDLQVQHRTIAGDLVEFRRLVVARQNEVLRKLTFNGRVKRNVHVNGISRVEVELARSEGESSNSNVIKIGLLAVVFVPFTEEFESSIAAGVHAAESHVDLVSDPGIEAVHRVVQADNGRLSAG